MSRFLRLCFGAMVRLFRSRKVLLVENLALRQQLSVFKRPNRRPKLGALDRLIPDRFLPDKAIDLIDEAGARVKLRQTSLPEESREVCDLEISGEVWGQGCKKVLFESRCGGCG